MRNSSTNSTKLTSLNSVFIFSLTYSENPKADYTTPQIPEYPLQGCQVRDPNEVIAVTLNEHEIQLINEDPNYFIKNKKFLEQIHLFNDRADEFDEDVNAKIRGKLIKEQFLQEQRVSKRREEMNRRKFY